jgi:tetratricopeptide (TPR) repeat protein
MKTLLLALIIIGLLIYFLYFSYHNYIKDKILIAYGLESHFVEDNGQKALKYYNKVNRYDIQEKIGNVYFYGTKNTHKDYDEALKYYKRVFMYDPDNKNIVRIREKINQITKFKLIKMIKDKKNNQNMNKKNEYRNYHEQILNDDIQDYITNIGNNKKIDTIENDIEIDKVMETININSIKDLENSDMYKRNTNTHIQEDDQSAHDIGVNNTIQASLSKLKKNTFIKYQYNEIYTKLLHDLERSSINNIDKFRIQSVLRKITQQQNFKVCGVELKECLTIVCNRIYTQTNKDNVNIILSNLFNELNDCIKDTGEILCLMGIFNRIIHCLNIVDELVVIKPTWALREELMRKCCDIRKNLEKKLSVDDPTFTEQLKNNIIITLKKEYVYDNKILSLEDFNTEIESWIEYI